LHPSHAVIAAERQNVRLQKLTDAPVLLHAYHLRCATARGFESHRPHTGKEIEHAGTVKPTAQDVEYGLLGAGTHRASAIAIRDLQSSRSKGAAENLEHRRIVGWKEGNASSGG